ncbi:MAG: 1-phosphofructokinase family hexose kinase [Planctomycetaceae bacterium]
MIIAAGLTPAWQQILTFREFHPGEVNRATSAHWCASGKVLNVGNALHHLGAMSRAVSFAGGQTGRAMRDELDALGAPTQWIESVIPTRVCTTILSESTGVTTELVENSSAVPQTELDQFIAAFEDEAARADWVILTGSLPQQTPADFYRRLMERSRAKFLLDVRGGELTECLPLQPFLVKPNREELAATIGRPITTNDELVAAMQELRKRGAQRVVISHGAQELWLLNAEGLTRFRPPAVPTVNPIGCGDCLAAGMAVAFSEGRDDVSAVRFGMAAAADNVQQLLPCRLDRMRVEQLAETVEVSATERHGGTAGRE